MVDRTVSDAEGRFTLGARAGSMHDVLAGGRRHPRRRVVPVAAGAELEIELSEPATITGLVIAQDGGWPVAGARVGVHSGHDRIYTYADQAGRFSVSPVLDELVVLTGYSPGFDVVVSNPVAPGWGDVVLELPPGRELSGTVVDFLTKDPVADATVTLRLLTESRPAGEPDPLAGRSTVEDHTGTSDAEGRYHLAGLPSRGFRMMVEAEEGVFALPTGQWDSIARLELVARDGEGRSARHRVAAGTLGEAQLLTLVEELAVDIAVVSAGEPVSGAQVLVISERGPPTTGRTDEDGTLHLVHPIAAPDVPTVWVQARHENRQSLPEEITLAEGRPTEPVVLDLEAGAWFTGTLHGAFGEPLASAVVFTDTGRFTSTDLDGGFELGPAALGESGGVKLTAQAVGYRSHEWEDTFPARDLALTLQPLLHWRGRATDASTGQLLEGVQCQLQAAGEGGEWIDVETRLQRVGQQGEFDIELPEVGFYRLRAHAQDYVLAESAPADFDGVHAPPVADLYLSPAAVLAVRVEDPSGRPVAGYRVWIVPAEIAADRELPRGVSGAGISQQRTNADGRVRFNLGSGGRLRLASGPGAWLDDGAFEVTAGAIAERRVVVPGLGNLDLALLDENGQPIAGLEISLGSAGDSYVHSVHRAGTVRQALSHIEVTDLPAGTYALRVAHDAYQEAKLEVRVDSGRTRSVEVSMRPRLGTDDGD